MSNETTDRALIWLKQFKHSWLPEKLFDNIYVREMLLDKILELEGILVQKHSDDHSDENFPIQIDDSHRSTERSLPTPPDVNHQSEDESNRDNELCRPSIRLKRISQEEAEEFLPSAWKEMFVKRNRRNNKRSVTAPTVTEKRLTRNHQRNKLATLLNHDQIENIPTKPRKALSASSITSVQSFNDEKKKSKRKLRAMEAEDDDLFTLGNLSSTDQLIDRNDCGPISRQIGQNGILSQTRRMQETITIITDKDDFPIILNSRQSIRRIEQIKENSKEFENSFPTTNTTIKDPNSIERNPSFSAFDVFAERVPDLNLNVTEDTEVCMINYPDGIEDISNDGIDPLSTVLPNLSVIE